MKVTEEGDKESFNKIKKIQVDFFKFLISFWVPLTGAEKGAAHAWGLKLLRLQIC
jgi:hypothetical protein